MHDDPQLDAFLQAHKVPPARAGRVDDIIRAAAQIPQKPNLWTYLKQIFAEFHLPAPAYSFASLILLGFVLGFSGVSESYAYDDSDTGQFAQLLDDDGEIYE